MHYPDWRRPCRCGRRLQGSFKPLELISLLFRVCSWGMLSASPHSAHLNENGKLAKKVARSGVSVILFIIPNNLTTLRSHISHNQARTYRIASRFKDEVETGVG
jgi:hypothetical protein